MTEIGSCSGTGATIRMRVSTAISPRALVWAAWIVTAACGESASSAPAATATVSGVVRAATGAVIEGAAVSVAGATAKTAADGRFQLENLPVGSATIVASAPRFDPQSASVNLTEGANAHDVSPSSSWGTRWVDAPRTGSVAFTAPGSPGS